MTEPSERTLVDALDGIKTMLGRLGVDGPDGQLGGIELLSNSISDPHGPSLADAIIDNGATISLSLDRVAEALNNIAQALHQTK